MYLTTIIGNKGSGKTLLLSIFAFYSKRKVLSNFKLKLNNYKELTIIDILNIPNKADIFIDEAHSWLESRLSGSALNIVSSDINFHSRKLHLDIYLSTIMFSTIDKRFRFQSDFIIYCYPRFNLKKDDFIFQFEHSETKSIFIWQLPYKNAKNFFSIYDTFEIIESQQKNKLEFKLIEQNPKQLLKKIKEISKIIKPKLNIITHDTIKTILFLEGINIGYEKYLYLYLNKKIIL